MQRKLEVAAKLQRAIEEINAAIELAESEDNSDDLFSDSDVDSLDGCVMTMQSRIDCLK